MTERYRYCGLELDSDLELPELPVSVADGPADLVIRQAAVPHRIDAARQRVKTYEYNDREALWRLDGVARYRIAEQGRLIEVEAASASDADSVRLFLLQSVFALAALLRGELMLNAAAVARDGQVTAFIGPAASGKSTAAAVLLRRGWRLVGDSLLRVSRDADGRMLAHPQAPWLWLWPDSLERLGFDVAAGEPLRPELALRRLSRPVLDQPLPLARVAILREQKSDDLDLFEPTPRQGAQAFEMLLHHSAGSTWLDSLADRRRLFLWSTHIARQAIVERLEIPWGWEQLDCLGERLADWCDAESRNPSKSFSPGQGEPS